MLELYGTPREEVQVYFSSLFLREKRGGASQRVPPPSSAFFVPSPRRVKGICRY